MVRPCPKCWENEAADCGHLVYSPWSGDYDCDAGDLNEVNPTTLCDDCPHIWCSACKPVSMT